MINPDASEYREFKMLGTIISSIVYGIIIVLSGRCFLLLFQKKRGIYSNRMRFFLLSYVAVMFFLSTLLIFQEIVGITFEIFKPLDLNSPSIKFTEWSSVHLLLTMWGADGLMIWRCVVLYQGLSRGLRILIIVLLSLLAIFSLGCGVVALVLEYTACCVALRNIYNFGPSVWWLVASSSTLVNIILALLIALRLIHHQRHIRKTLGADHGSLYSKVIAICVESSALIVIFNGLYLTLLEIGVPEEAILYAVLPHISVISSLLIVYRVAKGRAVTMTLPPSAQLEVDQIHFKNSTSRFSNQEREG